MAWSIFEMLAKIHHFGWTSEETIMQEHGVGPLRVNYLNPKVLQMRGEMMKAMGEVMMKYGKMMEGSATR